ncbi:hypothetical protein PSEUBRA_005281 [Kalmanozyma brasiliensis GHG001]|uniref:Serine aminopeptidase S33 domain-containing protein n=1 Tax=Kalmanozyma brasiliensis (strain GHG001) TaxID=1365824 RepID=V5E5V9_KALBG|nr:uncharacterized protein PSEUBRA_005281 [Kalmanozyma brasiliensis GHG001]EST05591.1 hypothetical protein PSEUBRA_005281 [Kalmanozyma brasiliensis GHG001]
MPSRCARVIKTLWEVWAEPLVETLGIHEPHDRSYGRCNVPFSPMEKRLHEKDDVEVSFHKVMLDNGKDWVWYQIWQDPVAIRQTGRNADMIFVHGTGVHSGTLASQCRRYLDAGFRLIVPDLPSHGFSSGLHVYQRDMSGFCAGLHSVLHDVSRRDHPISPPTKLERRPTFMLGLSFGGLVAFSYALQYPSSYRFSLTDPTEIPIDGLIGVGPMVAYNTRFVVVSFWMRLLFLFLLHVFQLGRLEVIVPHKRAVDRDPAVYESLIMQDPRSHQGAFRIGHLNCINNAMVQLQRRAGEIRHPVYIQMGGQDKVADTDAALKWIRATSSKDRRYEVYPICQHVIYKKAKSQHDDLAGRISVIADNVEWMVERAPPSMPTQAVGDMGCERPERDGSDESGASMSRTTSVISLFDVDDDETGSVATTALATPSLTDEESVAHAKAERSEMEVGGQSHVLPEHLRGWRTDEDGEKRLYRVTWNFKEDSRPFLYDPCPAPCSL